MPDAGLNTAEAIVVKPLTQHRNKLPAHRFKTRQRSHFAICIVLPTLLALLMPIALPDD
jgi:hypothetical protein